MRLPVIDTQTLTTMQTMLPTFWLYARASLGWCSIAVGMLGVIMPLLPGLPFLILGSYLVGHRDRRLRWMRVHAKLTVRYLSHSQVPVVRRAGRIARDCQFETMRYYRTWRARNRPALNPPEA